MRDKQSVCTDCLINKPAQHRLTLVTTELIEVNNQNTSGKKWGLPVGGGGGYKGRHERPETGDGRQRLSSKTDKRAGQQVLISEKHSDDITTI